MIFVRFFIFSLFCSYGLFATIRLGMSAAFSGAAGRLGEQYYYGAMIYIDRFNTQGGINGEKIQIIKYDDKYNPNLCIKNTIKLIERDNVLLLFNYVGTPTTTAILPLLKLNEDKNLILFGNFTGAPMQRKPPYSKYVFNVRASYSEETAALVDFFVKKGYKKIAVFYQIDSYGRSGFVGVSDRLKSYGLRVYAEATYLRKADFNTSMKVQASYFIRKGVGAVISVGYYGPCAAFVRDMRAGGFNGPIANISFVGTESFIKLLQDNNVSLDNLYFSEVVPYYLDIERYPQLISEFTTLCKREGCEATFVAFEGFINAKILCNILKNATIKINRENIRSIIENMPEIDIGLGFPIKYNKSNHQILHDVFIYKLKSDGTLVSVRSGS